MSAAKVKRTSAADVLGAALSTPAPEAPQPKETMAPAETSAKPRTMERNKRSYSRAGTDQANATVYLKRSALRQLKMISLEQDRPLNSILREALDGWLKDNGHGGLDKLEQ